MSWFLRRPHAYLGAAVVALGLVACSRESLREYFAGATPHERYERLLQETGLDGTALGRDWIAAATEALRQAISITSPYREESYLDPREAAASGYRVSLRRGQRLEVTFQSAPDSAYQVFLDLFRIGPDSTPRYLLSADSLERAVEYLARRDGDYLIRIQPELLRGGQYAISIVVGPSLEFPVSGHDTTAIRSFYGDPRDAGRRRHEGLDIFAPRGTPVLAAASGVVRSTRPNNLGGNVIWLRDDFGQTHYYAHLDRQAVRRGDRVQPGDTIGFVGNSGNARTTPPHLHFGLYQGGSFDPYPALYEPPKTPAAFTGDPLLIGGLVRVNRDRTRIRTLPSSGAGIVAELPLHTSMHVRAGTGSWYRVALPDGRSGFVVSRLVEPASGPIRSTMVAGGTMLLTDPDSAAAAVDRVASGSEVGVLARFGEFLFVRGPSGKVGWVASN